MTSIAVPVDARPKLARGVRMMTSEAHGGPVLLAPERVVRLDTVAADIVSRCDGTVTLAALIETLTERYAAPRETIAADVTTLLRALSDKRLIDL